MTDFEKFANHDRNISSMTLYRYGSVLDAYINPSIIEDRKLNIAAMDVFSHLMMDRIIFLGGGLILMLRISSRRSSFTWHQLMTRRTSRSILTRPVVWSVLVLASTTRCSSSNLISPPSARVWLLPWALFCFVPALEGRNSACRIPGY